MLPLLLLLLQSKARNTIYISLFFLHRYPSVTADQPKHASRDLNLGSLSVTGGSDAPPPPKDLIDSLAAAIVDQACY